MKKLLQQLSNFLNSLFKKKTVEEAEIISDNQDIINEVDTTIVVEPTADIVTEHEPDTVQVEKPVIEDPNTTQIKETKESKLSSKNPKYDKIVIFLTPGHTKYTPGKHSPDKSLYEWKYNRIILKMVEEELDKLGIQHWNSHPEDGWVDSSHQNDSKDLILRVQRINSKYTSVKKERKTAIMLSIHVNAAGNGVVWKNATGWSAWTTRGQNNSDKLANCLYDAAEEILTPLKKKIRTDKSDGDRDYESNFYVIKNSNCISVLTENFFMDSKQDCEWLLSDEGKKAVTAIHVEGIKKYIEKYI